MKNYIEYNTSGPSNGGSPRFGNVGVELKKLDAKNSLEFSIYNNFGHHRDLSLEKINELSFNDRIKEYKQISTYYNQYIKAAISGIEYAFFHVGQENFPFEHEYNVVVHFIRKGSMVHLNGIFYCTVNAIWDLLGFTPKNPIKLDAANKAILVLPYEFEGEIVQRIQLNDSTPFINPFDNNSAHYPINSKFEWR